MRKLTYTFLLYCLCVSLYAQYSIQDTDGVLNKKEAASLEQIIAYQLEFYNKVLPESSIKPTDVRLNIYSNYSAYLMYQKEQMKTTLHRSMGFYSSKNKEAVVCKDKHEKEFLSTCYHELSHFFVNTYFGSVPIWLNEGIAVYFGNMKPGKSVNHQVVKTYILRVKTMIDLRDIDLNDFLSWNRNKFYERSFSHESYGYALGYSIVQYLMQKDEKSVVSLIREIKNGKDSKEAIDIVYEGGFSSFEKDFMEYINKY
ncbi:DUF1570 domain-containing protein [Dysgonomonas sp. BGC7]|uniref:peptidase MA family metallohydrolase n=1 Tax=Dysgonomonas sp. BGC7 TaxID=1658008 RepID=UPI000680591D|nr:DUF1570 domain-containing protein [Dysgonomonas sp. BGC7]MBD8387811.1 DUF1570 domain-containing protein [Dysgonomonas sp. BGC7]